MGTQERVVRFVDGVGAGLHYGVHNPSMRNLCRGVAERVLHLFKDGIPCARIRPKQGAFSKLNGVKHRLLSRLCSTPVVAEELYPQLYHGGKRAVYERAAVTLLTRGFKNSDAYVSAFVKAEKINFSAKPDPPPRVIQPRSPVFNLKVGCYLKPFEHRLVAGFRAAFGYNVVLKGLNASGTARQLRENWETFVDPIAIELDASRFDQHVSVDALKYEHSVYNEVFKSPELRKLLRLQLHNKGFGRYGGQLLRYEVDGCRMSGDINTGMGNCLLMSLMVLGFADSKGIRCRLSNNGDDCVLVVERKDRPLVDGITQWFHDLGFDLKVEGIQDVFERIKFCQAQPLWTTTGWRMVRDIYTATSKDLVSLLGFGNQLEFNNWRHAIGTCGLELTRGVPMWEAFYKTLLPPAGAEGSTGAVERIMDSGLGYMARGVVGGVITEEVRYSFWRAFGIPPDAQVAYETTSRGIGWTVPQPLMYTNITSEHLSHYAKAYQPDERARAHAATALT